MVRDTTATIDAIVLDMTMPRMNGVEALFAIRKIVRDVPVILSSGYNPQEMETRFAEDKPAGFIQKPYKAADLIGKLHEVLKT